MTPDELITATKQHVGSRTALAGQTVDDTWYLARVNSAYRRIATFQGAATRPGMRQPQMRRLRFFELMDVRTTTVASGLSDNFIALDTDVYALLRVFDDTNERPIPRRSLSTMAKRKTTETGSILMWTHFGDANSAGFLIWKLPTVSTTLRLYVYKWPETLSAGGSAPVIPDDWHDTIHIAAGAEAARLLHMSDRAQELEGILNKLIAERATPIEEARTGGVRYMHIGPRASTNRS